MKNNIKATAKELFYSAKASKKELFYNDFSDEWENKINNLETNKRLRVVFGKLLNTKDLKGKKFLEIGCGLGYFSNKAFKLGAKVTGIDIGSKLVEISWRKTPKAKFITASAAKPPFADGSFETVLSTEVIEHVENQKKALSEMVRVVKKGGVLVITTPNRLYKPLFDFLSLIKLRPYHGNEKWMYPWDMKKILLGKNMELAGEYYFNFIYPTAFFDRLENSAVLKYFCINYGYKFKKL